MHLQCLLQRQLFPINSAVERLQIAARPRRRRRRRRLSNVTCTKCSPAVPNPARLFWNLSTPLPPHLHCLGGGLGSSGRASSERGAAKGNLPTGVAPSHRCGPSQGLASPAVAGGGSRWNRKHSRVNETPGEFCNKGRGWRMQNSQGYSHSYSSSSPDLANRHFYLQGIMDLSLFLLARLQLFNRTTSAFYCIISSVILIPIHNKGLIILACSN